METDLYTPDYSAYNEHLKRQAELKFAKNTENDFAYADEEDPVFNKSRDEVLKGLLAPVQGVEPQLELNPEFSALVKSDDTLDGITKTFQAQEVFNKIEAGNYDLTREEFNVYDEHVGELRKATGDEMGLMHFASGVVDSFGEAFSALGNGVAEVYRDNEYGKIIPSLIEGGARDTRELLGSAWHSRNKNSMSYAVKQFLTGADTQEERWANFEAAQSFARNTDKYLKGEAGLVFDPRYTNKNLVTAGETLADPAMLLGLVSGGAGMVASVARSAGRVGASRALRAVAKSATVVSRASDYVTGLPLKAVGYPLWLGGAAAVKVTTGSLELAGKVASRLTGGAIEATTVSSALRTVGLGSAALGADPISRKFATFYGLGLVSEGLGGVAVGTAQGLARKGGLTAIESLAQNSTIPVLSRRIGQIAAKIDNIIPIPSLTVDALRGGMMGMSFNALLGAYSDGVRGAYTSAQAGFGYGAFGGAVGGALSKVANLSGRHVMLSEFDAVLNEMDVSDKTQADNIRSYVDRYDKLGVETRHYVLGVSNQLAGTAKVVYLNQKEYSAFTGPAGASTSGFFAKNVGNNVSLVAVNIDQISTPTGNAAVDRAKGLATAGTGVHEMFHSIMWNHGYKKGMINRLTHHLLGMEVNGERIIGTSVNPDEIESFFSVYAKKLAGKTDISQSQWYKDTLAGLAEYKANGTINEGLRNGVEEFGALFFEEWIRGKPMDYLFRGGDIGLSREAFHSIKESFGNAIRYGLKTMGHDLVSAGYSFTEVDAKLNKGGIRSVTMREGMLAGNNVVKDPVMDRIMQDIVRNTWKPIANTTIDTLEGDGLRVWAEMSGNERRIYKDKKGVWKFKDVKQFRREEGLRGTLLFKTLEDLKASGIDIGAEIVDDKGIKRIEGHLNAGAIKALVASGAMTATEGRHAAAIQLAVERGSDHQNKQPNGLRFEYHGLSEEVEMPDGTVVRNRRPWQNVDISDRRVIPYRYEYVLTTRDAKGNKIDPEYQEMITAIDLNALDRRINANFNTPIRMKNGQVTTVGKLLSGQGSPNWASIRGKVRTYLANLSSSNAKPSALLFGAGPVGAATRDALYSIFGTVPSKTSSFINKPNASLPANKRGLDFVFTTFRKDLMYNIEETQSRLTFNEELAYPRAQANYKPSEEMLSNENVIKPSLRLHTKNKPSLIGRDGQPVLSGKKALSITSEFALNDGTKVFETNKGIYVRSNLTRDDIVFSPEKIYGEDGKPMLDEKGKNILTDPWSDVNNYLNIQTEFTDAIASTNIENGYGVVEFGGKYLVIEQSKTGEDKYIVSSRVFDNHEDAEDAARKIYVADTTHQRIMDKNVRMPVVNSQDKKIKSTEEHRLFASKRLRELTIRNVSNPESTPLEYEMVNGIPVVLQTSEKVDGKTVLKYELKVKGQYPDLLGNAGISISTKLNDAPTYVNTTSKYASKLVDDFRSQISDPDVKGAIDWYKKVRREIRFLYGPNSDMFFEMLGATSPNEGPEQNWKYAVEAMERYIKGDFDVNLEKAAQQRDSLIKTVEDGTFRTMLEKARAQTNAREFFENLKVKSESKGQPFTYTEQDIEAEAAKRYNALSIAKMQAAEILAKKHIKLGDGGKKKIADIQALISSNTIDSDTKLSSLTAIILGRNGYKGMHLTKKDLILASHKELNRIAKEFGDTITRPSTNKNSLGKSAKFGMHNQNIAQVMLGMYERLNYGPKTYNYQLNLKGAGEKATIDIWATRSLRRIIMEANGAKKWRILFLAEEAISAGDKYVSERSNFDSKNIITPEGKSIDSLVMYNDAVGDFFFGQDIFAEAARQIREEYASDPELNLLEPHELQAIMWFREKKLWSKNRWTSGAGAALSSYETRAREAIGTEAPVDAEDFRAFKNVQRFSISGSMSTPTTSGGSTGKVGDINSTVASDAVKKRVMQTLGPALKTGVFAPTVGVYAGNFSSKEGFYKGTESALGLDWTVQGDAKRLDSAYVEAIKLGIDIGMNGQQDTVAVHERVTSRHPNARDTYTVYLDRQYDADSASIEALYSRMAQLGEFSGLTLEPSMARVGGKVKVVALTFHHVPEFDVLYNGTKINNQSNVEDSRRSFKKRMETTLFAFGWGKEVAMNADGSTNYARGRGVSITQEINKDGIDLSKMIADVSHGFINTTVVTHNEYANVDPVYLSRRNTSLLQNIQRVQNHNERAKQKREAAREQGEYARPRKPLPEISSTPEEQGGETGTPYSIGQEGGVPAAPSIETNGKLSDPLKADEYIESTRKVFDPSQIRNHTSLVTVGANADYVISRGVTNGKSDAKVRVTHKTDSFPASFNTEAEAMDYVRGRLAGEIEAPKNKEEAYDYYVRGKGVVSGIRRPAIDRLEGESDAAYKSRTADLEGSDFDNFSEKMSGALSGNDPFFGFFQQANASETERGPFGSSVYVDTGDGKRSFKPTEFGPDMNENEFGKWRSAVAGGDTRTAQAIVNSVLSSKGFDVNVPYYHGSGKTAIGEPRNWRAFGLSPTLYIAQQSDAANTFGIYDSATRGKSTPVPQVHTLVLSKDINLFEADSPVHVEKIKELLRDPQYVVKTVARCFAQLEAFKKNNADKLAKEKEENNAGSQRTTYILDTYQGLTESFKKYIQNPTLPYSYFVQALNNMKKNGKMNALSYDQFESGILAIAVKDAGFDGYYEVEHERANERSIAVINPEKVKSSDPVTYGTEEEAAQGKPVDISMRGDVTRTNIAYKPAEVSASEDMKYADLVAKGDMDGARKMIEDVRKRRGYSDKTYYHGTATPESIKEFSSRPNAGIAVHLSPQEMVAQGFSEDSSTEFGTEAKPTVYKVRAKTDNLFDSSKKDHTDRLLAKLIRTGIPEKLARSAVTGVKREGFAYFEMSYNSPDGKFVDSNYVQNAIQELGFDGYFEREADKNWPIYYKGKKYKGTDQTLNPRNIAMHKSNYVKSEDVVTYDDRGQLIPLSKRFDITSPDIRYKPSENGKLSTTVYSNKESAKSKPEKVRLYINNDEFDRYLK